MTDSLERVEQNRRLIQQSRERGTGATLWAYTRLSGPGWLQSAITLGGGSLAGALYLGLIAGFGLMWLQPLAMILGVIMLSAIGYVSLSTGERPFDAINKHVNPVLGWGWAIATLMANLVWCMPQFALGTAAIQQNLAPGLLGSEAMPDHKAKILIVGLLFTISAVVVWCYDSGNRGIKIFEGLLKVMVGVIVLCFFGVVLKMSFEGVLDWGNILTGFVPDPSMLYEPAAAFKDALAATGDYADFWKSKIVDEQQKVLITAAATAVGINMTFLFPYSMLRRGWDKDFRGLAIFDLSTSLFIPYLLATSCILIASASQFHAQPAPGFLGEKNKTGGPIEPAGNLVPRFNKLVDGRIAKEIGAGKFDDLKKQQAEHESQPDKRLGPSPLERQRAELPAADRRLAAMLVHRDAFNLARSLQPLAGKVFSHYLFGVGLLGMAISTIIILMLISGFVVCEIFGLPAKGMAHFLGCLLAGAAGASGPFIWSTEARIWLSVPTSMFGMVLLPIAYFTFFLMMNSKSLLGDNLPQGGRRVCWNILMGIAAVMAAFGSYWSIRNSPYSKYGLYGLAAFVGLAVLVHYRRSSNISANREK